MIVSNKKLCLEEFLFAFYFYIYLLGYITYSFDRFCSSNHAKVRKDRISEIWIRWKLTCFVDSASRLNQDHLYEDFKDKLQDSFTVFLLLLSLSLPFILYIPTFLFTELATKQLRIILHFIPPPLPVPVHSRLQLSQAFSSSNGQSMPHYDREGCGGKTKPGNTKVPLWLSYHEFV